jgi:hypothetical protein
MTFRQQLVVTLIDKGLLAVLVLVLAHMLSVQLQGIRTQQELQVKAAEGRYERELAILKSRLESDAADRKAQRETEAAARNQQAALNGQLQVERVRLQDDLRKAEIARAQDAREQRVGRRRDVIARQLNEFYWPLYVRLQKDNAIWRTAHDARWKTPSPSAFGRALEQGTILPNHREVVRIIETSKIAFGRPDEEIVTEMKSYLRHVSIYEALRATGSADDPQGRDAPYPGRFFHLVCARTWALQMEYDATEGQDHSEEESRRIEAVCKRAVEE